MKKLLLIVVLFFGISSCAFASTYYVRLDGGTQAQCNGLVNSSYISNGTSIQQGCAFSNPRYALGYSIENNLSGILKGGDTLYIYGDLPSDTTKQAQYLIGYDDTGAGTTPACSQFWSYDCQLNNIPAGTSTQPTSIIGTGNHKPQLWGNQRVWQVLQANNNYITLQNLEITDHSACAYNAPSSGCNYNNYPYGPWSEDGLVMSGNGITLTNVYIHGLGRYGINTGNLGNVTFTNVQVIGNGYGGITVGNNGSTSVSGTLIFNQPTIEWNGCVESYPISAVDLPSNYKNCFGQNSSGYGDGLAFGANGNQSAGNWTIIGPGSISFNTQDGLDTLHGTGTGTIQIDKIRFEGNGGNQVKINALNGVLTNSIIIGDCGWWYGASQSATNAMLPGDSCRALGNTISYFTTAGAGTTDTFYNNTILGNGNVQFLQNGSCDSTTKLNIKNNIVYGGYFWGDDQAIIGSGGGNSQIAYLYAAGVDGNGSQCSGQIINEDYNIVTGSKNNNQGCNGLHDKCGIDPKFIGIIPIGTSGGAPNTYYQGQNATSLVSLLTSSPAISAGVSGLQYWNTSNDYNGAVQTNPPVIGAQVVNGVSPIPPCISNGSCTATTPACGTTTIGVDNCGTTCSKVGAICPTPVPTPTPCVATWCDAPIPVCGTSNSGHDSCGNVCTKFNQPCAPVCPTPTVCTAPVLTTVTTTISSNGKIYTLSK